MLINENVPGYIGYVLGGHTLTEEIIKKLKCDELLQYANELGEFTKENLIKFMEYVKSLLTEDEQSRISLEYYGWRFRRYDPKRPKIIFP